MSHPLIIPLGKWDVCRTNYPHPDITSGMHTNGHATVWVRSNGEWLSTGLHHMHKVAEWLREFGEEYIDMLRSNRTPPQPVLPDCDLPPRYCRSRSGNRSR